MKRNEFEEILCLINKKDFESATSYFSDGFELLMNGDWQRELQKFTNLHGKEEFFESCSALNRYFDVTANLDVFMSSEDTVIAELNIVFTAHDAKEMRAGFFRPGQQLHTNAFFDFDVGATGRFDRVRVAHYESIDPAVSPASKFSNSGSKERRGLLTKKDMDEYFEYFNSRDYDNIVSYFADDVELHYGNNFSLESLPIFTTRGKDGFIAAYRHIHRTIDEKLHIGKLLIDDRNIFVEMWTEWCAFEEAEDNFMGLKMGEVFICTNYVLYELDENDKFKDIRVGHFRVHDPKEAFLTLEV